MKVFLKCCLIGFLGSLFSVPFLALGWNIYEWTFPIGFVLYLIISYLTFRKYSPASTTLLVGAGLLCGVIVSASEGIILSIVFKLQLMFIPQVLIRYIAIFCGFLLWRVRSSAVRIVTVSIGAIIALFIFFSGADLWLHYISYRNFTGKIGVQRLEQEVSGVDEEGIRFSNRSFEGKIVLLDFWMTQCAVCFKKFPLLQNFYDTHKDSPSIEILAVNKPLEEDEAGQAFKMIRERGFNFKILLPDDEALPEKFGVLYYPTTFVLDTEGNLVYRGRLEGAIDFAELLMKHR